jgi:hypothetical protein
VTNQDAIVQPPQTRLDRVGFGGDEIPRHQFQFAGGQGGDPWTSGGGCLHGTNQPQSRPSLQLLYRHARRLKQDRCFNDLTITMQPIKPIRTEADYERALEEINLYLEADEGSEERDRLELLSMAAAGAFLR